MRYPAVLISSILDQLSLKCGEDSLPLEARMPEGIDPEVVEARFREWVRQERIALANDKELHDNPEYQELEAYCKEKGLDIRFVASDILNLRVFWKRTDREG